MRTLASSVLERGRVTLISALIIGVIASVGGFYFFTEPTDAAGLTTIKATLTDPRPATVSDWTLQFVTDTLINEGDTIVLDFDTVATTDQFTIGPTMDFTDVDLAEDTDGSPSSCSGTLTDETLGASPGASTWGVTVSTSTDTITFTAPNDAATYIAANACVIVEIGTVATSGVTGDVQITNPAKSAAVGTADIYDVAITFTGNAASNSGTALVAVIEAVTVSVTIDESLSFSIAPVAAGSCTGGGAATAITTTTTTVPFGSSGVASETFYKGCHTLTVSTNASSGYAITTEENTSLIKTGNTAIPDTTCDGADCTEVIASGTTNAWATATVNGFGYTCTGSSCNAAFTDGGAGLGFSQFPCRGSDAQCTAGSGSEGLQTPISASSPVSADASVIIYKLSFDSLQPAGDYSNRVTYIATPTF